MYLLGHTDRRSRCASISRSSTWARAASRRSEQAIGCTVAEAFTLLSDRGVLAPKRHPSEKKASSSVDRVTWKAQKRLRRGDFSEAADGTRTHDLLHGKQTHMEPARGPFACKWG
jgi:hypothetical protein